MNNKFAVGSSIVKLLKESFEKFVSKLILAERAFVGELISNESRTRLLEAEEAKILNLEVKSLKVAGETVGGGMGSLTDEQMEELKAIITGTGGMGSLTNEQMKELEAIITGKSENTTEESENTTEESENTTEEDENE